MFILSPQQLAALQKFSPLKILLGYFGTGKVGTIFLIFSNHINIYLQTTIGRLLCEKATDLKMVDNIYYIVLARDSDGDQLKKQFREDFQTENLNVNITVLNKQEA